MQRGVISLSASDAAIRQPCQARASGGDESRVTGAVVREDAATVETVEGDVPYEPVLGFALIPITGAGEAEGMDLTIDVGKRSIKGNDAELS